MDDGQKIRSKGIPALGWMALRLKQSKKKETENSQNKDQGDDGQGLFFLFGDPKRHKIKGDRSNRGLTRQFALSSGRAFCKIKIATMNKRRGQAKGPNLYLVGFMGTGKSTHGRALARRLGFRFLDSDHEIERQAGCRIPELFAREGEEAFRAREREFMRDGHPEEGCVVSCGGGLIIPPGMLELVKTRGVVVCLVASLETILQRTSGNADRPLLKVDQPAERISQLLAEREPVYRKAGPLVLTDNRTKTDIQNHLLRIYLRKAAEFARNRPGGAATPRLHG